MCFVLYIATPKPLPVIPWNDETREIHTVQLTEHDQDVAARFRHRHVCYIGSDTYCGCGFRNARNHNGGRTEETWSPEDDSSNPETQPNHARLVEFIRRHVPEESCLELYGMWEDDFSYPALSEQSIALERLLDPDFYFRDRGHYTLTIA